MSNELDKVKAKIAALANMTVSNGASINEANYAMVKVGELLEQYNLTMDEISIRAEKCITDFVQSENVNSSIMDKVAVRIAEFCQCRVWQSATGFKFNPNSGRTTKKGKVFNFFGLESDVQMAIYLMKVVHTAYNTSWNIFRKSDHYLTARLPKRSLTTNFLVGFAAGINDKLLSMTIARNTRERGLETGTALVFVKDNIVDEEFSRLGMNLRKTYTTKKYCRDDFSKTSGNIAGSKVNLGRPVTKTNNLAIK